MDYPEEKKENLSEAYLTLSPMMDIVNAASFHGDLEKALVSSKRIILNAEKVERITTPAIQLMLSAAKTLQEQQGELVIENPSAVLKEAVADLGLTSQLAIKEAH